METKRTITIQLTEDQHKKAKIAAAHAGMTFKEIFLDGIQKLDESRDGEVGCQIHGRSQKNKQG